MEREINEIRMIVGYINQDLSFLFDIIYYKSLNALDI